MKKLKRQAKAIAAGLVAAATAWLAGRGVHLSSGLEEGARVLVAYAVAHALTYLVPNRQD